MKKPKHVPSLESAGRGQVEVSGCELIAVLEEMFPELDPNRVLMAVRHAIAEQELILKNQLH